MSLDNIFYLLLLLCASGVGFFNYNKLSTPFKLIALLCAIIFTVEVAATFLYPIVGSTSIFYHFLCPVHILFMGGIYSCFFNSNSKRVVLISATCLALGSLLLSLFYYSVFQFPSIGVILLGYFTVITSLITYYNMLKAPSHEPILQDSKFWFISGNLLFYTVSLLHFSLLTPDDSSGHKLPDWGYLLINIANLILYATYLLALVLEVRKVSKNRVDEFSH